MRLIIIGCEYAGKSTLAAQIRVWGQETLGGTIPFHDHFVFPDEEASKEEQQQLLALVPSLKEKYQRYMIDYHFGTGFYSDNDHCLIGFYYSEAVYAPLYYGYGGPGEYADRVTMAKALDHKVMQVADDTVLVLLRASPEVIRERMAADPDHRSVLQEKDIELVLKRFEELFAASLIRRQFALETTTASIEETFAEFLSNIEGYLTQADRLRILTHQNLGA